VEKQRLIKMKNFRLRCGDAGGIAKVGPSRRAGEVRIPARCRNHASLIASVIFVSVMLGTALVAGESKLAIYSVSFWHYYLYWLAYFFGAVSLRVFKRDAMLMKGVALVALGAAYLAAPPNLLSLTLVALGFMLNSVAAAALGSDRTYYGHEVADLPQLKSAAFPYSVMSHPMLLGNVAAFGGTLINSEFRQQWWPLACAHVGMNIGLLAMELFVTPQRRSARLAGIAGPRASAFSWRTGCFVTAAGAALGIAASWMARTNWVPLSAWTGACVGAYGYFLYCCYVWSAPLRPERRKAQTENSHE
jgi:hypothetical protein